MTYDDLVLGNTTDLQPLLDHSCASETVEDNLVSRRSQKRRGPTLLIVCAGVALLLVVHILSVALLRKATITIEKLKLPDVCHKSSVGEIIVTLQNPSYCSPVMGPLTVTLTKKNTAFLIVHAPAFELQSGLTTLVSQIEFELLSDPNVFYNFVLATDGDIDVFGEIPVRISCMLVPFTIHLDVSNLFGEKVRQRADASSALRLQHTLGFPLYGVDTWRLGVVDKIKTELKRVVTQVLKTIALSHFYTYADDEGIFAFTEVSFEFESWVLWNVPSLSVKVQTVDRQIILVAGLKQFDLGSGQTFISAYTEIFKNQSDPLQSILQAYLAGNDLVLFARGGNGDTDCYSLHVLDLVDIKVDVPGKIDGKPAFLRQYSIRPSLKELDSKTHKCLLELELYIMINNPLPIHFDLFGIDLDLLFTKKTMQNRSTMKFLAHVNNTKHVSWSSHVESSVVLKSDVHYFDICTEVVDLYLHDQLTFDIQHGHIYMGVGSGNLTIPFSATDIHIHPGWSSTHELIKDFEIQSTK